MRRISTSFKAVFAGQARNIQYIDVFLVIFTIALIVGFAIFYKR